MSFGYTEAEKKYMLHSISEKEATIKELEIQKARAKNDKDKNSYDWEIKRLKNEIAGLKAYMK